MGKIFRLGSDVDTNQIITSQHPLHPSVEEMAPRCFEPLDENFTSAVGGGDFAVVHDNFGCDSSREQAPAVLKALGVRVVFANSFMRVLFRNAINIGLPVIVCEGLIDRIRLGEELSFDMESSTVCMNGQSYHCTKLPLKMQATLDQGGLTAVLNREEI